MRMCVWVGGLCSLLCVVLRSPLDAHVCLSWWVVFSPVVCCAAWSPRCACVFELLGCSLLLSVVLCVMFKPLHNSPDHSWHVGFEFVPAVTMKSAFLWSVTPSRSEEVRRFRGTHCPPPSLGSRLRHARNQQVAGGKYSSGGKSSSEKSVFSALHNVRRRTTLQTWHISLINILRIYTFNKNNNNV
jgi:hypothetical protein